MEDKKERCECGWCIHGMSHNHFLLRLVLGILILALAFLVGLKVGEMRSDLYYFGYRDGAYGNPMMRYPSGYMMNPGYYYGSQPSAGASPSAPTTPGSPVQ